MNKAEIGSEIILWITIVVVAIIAGTWFINRISPATDTQDALEADLLTMQDTLFLACTSESYMKQYNPLIEQGSLTLVDNNLCINATDLNGCIETPCSVTPFSIDLSAVTTITIRKQSGEVTIT